MTIGWLHQTVNLDPSGRCGFDSLLVHSKHNMGQTLQGAHAGCNPASFESGEFDSHLAHSKQFEN